MLHSGVQRSKCPRVVFVIVGTCLLRWNTMLWETVDGQQIASFRNRICFCDVVVRTLVPCGSMLSGPPPPEPPRPAPR